MPSCHSRPEVGSIILEGDEGCGKMMQQDHLSTAWSAASGDRDAYSIGLWKHVLSNGTSEFDIL